LRVRVSPARVKTAMRPHTVTSTHLVEGSGFRVQGSGFRVQGSGFRVQGSGFKV